MYEKNLNLHKYIIKEIKLDKIRPNKYNSPTKIGCNGLGGKVGPKRSKVLFCKEKVIKMARNHNT